jgi:Outer membrane protein beta-barrel domain
VRCLMPVLLVACVVIPVTASAQIYVAGSGGLGFYSMEDVNGDIGVNVELGRTPDWQEIEGGAQFGFGAGYRFRDRWAVGIAYRRLMAASEWSSDTEFIRYEMPSNAYLATAEFVALRRPRYELGLALAGGVTVSAATVHVGWDQPGFPREADFEGTGNYLSLQGVVGIPVGSRFHVRAELGRRWASADDIEALGQKLVARDRSDYEIDYSGVFATVGLRFWIGG